MRKKIGIIGGGIIGLAIGKKISEKYPQHTIILFEKEKSIGQHQSGNNSGVLHCGLYYKPGSLKAQLAVSGIRQMTEYCIQNDIEHEICGKVVVATNDKESQELRKLYQRGTANGLQGLAYLDKAALTKREPYVWAQDALFVPEEGIVDFGAVMSRMKHDIEERDGLIITNTKIDGLLSNKMNKTVVSNGIDEWELDMLISCAGLMSDRVYELMIRKKSPIKIIPFRGEYLSLTEEAEEMVQHLIYPVPDAQYPFLGVHFTRMIDGLREVGPNAVFATKREGYSHRQVNLKDTFESISYKGMHHFLRKNFAFSMNEFYTSLNKNAFLKKAKKLIPELEAKHLTAGNAGVRAQAIDPQGNLLMDFNIIREGNKIFVLNAPSPGATASLAIADYILAHYVDGLL